mmetsp:Transcript_65945/g.124731  ORF Transcript_65945/g.124731 Transcript_65945/m.124731 type:complete len:184 (-) Transcript_65945:222-773(-)
MAVEETTGQLLSICFPILAVFDLGFAVIAFATARDWYMYALGGALASFGCCAFSCTLCLCTCSNTDGGGGCMDAMVFVVLGPVILIGLCAFVAATVVMIIAMIGYGAADQSTVEEDVTTWYSASFHAAIILLVLAWISCPLCYMLVNIDDYITNKLNNTRLHHLGTDNLLATEHRELVWIRIK